MSTKMTRALLTVPRTDFGVHVFRDCIDQRTYVGVGTWRREAIVQVPRFWLRYSKRGRPPCTCPPKIMLGEVPDCARHGRAPK